MFKLSAAQVGILFYLSLGVFILYLLMPKVFDVREVSKYPELFEGNIKMAGKMQLIDDHYALYWLLDCKDDSGCIGIQSTYDGQNTDIYGVIIAYGQIRHVDKTYLSRRGKYYFEVHEIKAIEDNALDNLSYSIRGRILLWGRMARVWLYERCEKCSDIKNSIISTTLFP